MQMFQPKHTQNARFALLRPKLLRGGSERTARYVRDSLALWVGLNGLIAISFSLRHIVFGRFSRTLFFATNPAWLFGHSILVGLLLLYLARQLWLGERRAAVLASVLLLVEVLYTGIVGKEWLLAILFGLPLIALLYYRNIFDRHGSMVGFRTRLRFVASGVLTVMAVVIALTIAVRVVRHQEWQHSPFDVARIAKRVVLLEISADASDSIRVRALDHSLTLLGASAYLWIVVGIFLPASSFRSRKDINPETLRKLLMEKSRSSEDYFKLWPADKHYYQTKAGGVIAFGEANGIIIALANPINDKAKEQRDITEFLRYTRQQGFKSAWLLVGEASKPLYEAAGYKTIQIGSSARVDIAAFCEQTIRDKWWRWQLNRGRREGLRYVLQLPPHDPSLLQEAKTVSELWLTRPGHREQTFAMGYYDETYLQACRLHCLYAASGELAAFANEVPIFGNSEQTTVDMIRFQPAINGAMPFLLAHTIQQLREQGKYHFFDLGLVPLAEIDTNLAKVIRQFAASRFSAHGLAQFKNKFDPTWLPEYIAYDGDVLDLAKIFLALNKVMDYEEVVSG